MPIVNHADILDFAQRKVNLPKDDADDYRAQVRTLRKKLKAYIDEHEAYSLVKMLHSGSVAKGTALSTINDMDVAVYLKKADVPNDERQVVNWMVARLREAYGDLIEQDQVQPSCHCATIKFKGTGLNVDVVPVIYEGEPDDRGYLVSKETGDRIYTSVRLHKEFVRERKRRSPHYAQVVRLLKWWARTQKSLNPQFRMKSLVIELLCAHLQTLEVEDGDYAKYLESFFVYIVKSQLKERIAFFDYYKAGDLPPQKDIIEVFDPVNPLNNITSNYDELTRYAICEAAHTALDSIGEAHYATTKDRSVNLWKNVLGPGFRV
jgi:hypothetical protein